MPLTDEGQAWHNLAHSIGISGNIPESPRTPKILKQQQKYENFTDIKALRMASQAYDEGSIPFTRSVISISYGLARVTSQDRLL
jgi:hypothetical protein